MFLNLSEKFRLQPIKLHLTNEIKLRLQVTFTDQLHNIAVRTVMLISPHPSSDTFPSLGLRKKQKLAEHVTVKHN